MDAPHELLLTPPVASGVGREAVRDPLGFFVWLTQTYGDIVQYRSSLEPAYLINHPEFIQHVLLSNATNYNKDTFLNKHLIESVAGQGLLTSENPLWRQQRQVIQPAFHRRSLGRFEDVMQTATAQAVDRLEVHAREGEAVDISDEMVRVTLDIVTRSLFSSDILAEAGAIGQAMDTMVSIGKPKHRLVQEAISYLDRLVVELIQTRMALTDAAPDDLLTTLLTATYPDGGHMPLQQVRDEVMALMIAGHETTANTLSWSWYLLGKNPEVMAQMQAELDRELGGRLPTMADADLLPYTTMVIQESMRLYPSAWSISRRALGQDEIGGYHIPANAIVAMSPYTMHRHPDYWPEPERFQPERFEPAQIADRPHFAYFPFGGGARQCIGRHFAMAESLIVMATVAQRYHLELVPDHPVEPHALVTLRPRHGILMRVRPRT
jgi:cytochrome P450